MNAVCFGMMMCMMDMGMMTMPKPLCASAKNLCQLSCAQITARNENLQRDAGKPTSRFCLERKFVTMERGSVYKQPGVRM